MNKIRVLIVDDAVVVRRIVADALSGEPDIEVVGSAANGRIALAKVPQLNPDVIILDVEMPEMDGLAALEELRKTHPRLPVIMFSNLTLRGAAATLDALALGATDYVTKPTHLRSTEEAISLVRDSLVPRIRTFCDRSRPRSSSRSAAGPTRQKSQGPSRAQQRIDVVAIAVSTGGPNALAAVLPQLPRGFPVPIVIVQHMPPIFTKFLADRLGAQSAIEIHEGAAGDIVKPGHAYLAPGDYHLLVERRGETVRLATNQAPPENSCRPAGDVLFRSVAEVYREHSLGLVMTGMGRDGLRGCERVHEAGGRVLVQDEATSIVWGMPGFVAHAGLAEKEIPVEGIAEALCQAVGFGRSWTSSATSAKAGHGG